MLCPVPPPAVRGSCSPIWRMETALAPWVGLPGLPVAQRLGGGLEEPQGPSGDHRFLWASSCTAALPSGSEKVVENALFSLSLGG